jgi:pimeloyl-ACP methyl ester carboxylesterase
MNPLSATAEGVEMSVELDQGPSSDGAVDPAGRRVRRRAIRIVLGVIVLAVVAFAVWLAPVVFSGSPPAAIGAVAASVSEPEGIVRAVVNGVTLPYLDRGDGPPVLLIHGNGPDMRSLEGVATDLIEDHRVITYNRRGYAGSGPVATSWTEHLEDAAALLEHLGMNGAAVVGVSGGGIVALDLAVERPDLVGALVLVEPAVYGMEHMTPSAAQTYLAVQLRRRALPDDQASVPFFRWVMQHDDGHSVWDQPDYSEERKRLILRNGAGVLADIDNAGRSDIDKERVSAIDAPVTFIVGEQSQRWFHRIIATLEDLLPEAELIEIPAVGHAMTFEDPPAVASAVRRGVSAQG